MSASKQFAENAKCPAPDIGNPMTDPMAKRMEALVKRMAADWSYMSDGRSFSAEARAIVALLPEPVDADREEAKKIAAEWYSEEAPHIDPLTAAIRRGRALERGSREG